MEDATRQPRDSTIFPASVLDILLRAPVKTNTFLDMALSLIAALYRGVTPESLSFSITSIFDDSRKNVLMERATSGPISRVARSSSSLASAKADNLRNFDAKTLAMC